MSRPKRMSCDKLSPAYVIISLQELESFIEPESITISWRWKAEPPEKFSQKAEGDPKPTP